LSDRVRGPAVWVATFGGVGYFPFAPGTAGSAAAVALAAGILAIPDAAARFRIFLLLAAVVLFALGVWAAGRAESYFGKMDPGEVVLDEVVGQFLTLAAVPEVSWLWLGAGFLVFRGFDILKPFPARRAEKLHGGMGIMLDDVIAGAYGAAILFAAGQVL